MLPDNSIDSIVTDPPYELGFMGKKWDNTGIAYNVELWRECLRVLKHGGHLLSFGGTRTYHRMACAIEDAGFEIRDQIQWIYAQGFPKSQDVGKAIDKRLGAKREVIGKRVHPTLKNNPNVKSKAFHVETLESNESMESWDITAPSTSEAKQWNGWGTALKPAHEPIVLARKPLIEKTIAENILSWGVGGINIDASRIESPQSQSDSSGRFPANIIFDELSGEILDEQSGVLKSGDSCVRTKVGSFLEHGGLGKAGDIQVTYGDSGGASRFFYCAKASKKEKGVDNTHPTVKPIKLMEYLVTLVTPINGVILDPFTGSGSTLVAAKNLGFNYIGIEKEEEYIAIINKRLA